MKTKVLVVEDNDLNMKLFIDLLSSMDCEVLESYDGVDAVALVEKYLPSLIIMDIQLPIISGIELTKILKAKDRTKRIPVIAVTAFAMPGDKELLLSAGCDAYMSKPVKISEFTKMVEKMLVPKDPAIEQEAG